MNIIEKNNLNAKIKLYLSEEITFEELKDIIRKLNIDPIDLVRKKEGIIKKEKLDLKSMSNKEIIETLISFPILIERPILISKTEAVIGRPPELIKSIL